MVPEMVLSCGGVSCPPQATNNESDTNASDIFASEILWVVIWFFQGDLQVADLKIDAISANWIATCFCFHGIHPMQAIQAIYSIKLQFLGATQPMTPVQTIS